MSRQVYISGKFVPQEEAKISVFDHGLLYGDGVFEGILAAGRPMLAEEHIEGRYQIDPKIFQPRAHYLLKVRGMSMKDIGIMDGDLVAVHRTPEVRNRQVVVARLDNEVTVKRYKQDGKIVWLLPENEEFEPIRVDLKEQSLIIEGIVVGVLRQGGKSKGLFQ
jgi:repressor LexA